MSKLKEAIVIVLDAGQSVSEQKDDEQSFFEKSKMCLSMILQRKLFSKSIDEVGLILIGTEQTVNSLDYANISIGFPLATPHWEMLEFVEKGIKPTKVNADWLDGIVVALQFIRDETDGKQFSQKKLVLFSNFVSEVSDDQVDIIIRGMKSLGVEITVIGPDIIPDQEECSMEETNEVNTASNTFNGSQLKKYKTEEQEAGEALIAKIVQEVGGVVCSFEDAIPHLMFYQKKAVRPTPWNVEMTIGPEIKIPVSGYIKISQVSLPPWKTMLAADPKAPIEKETSYFKQDETQTAVDKADVIDGYCFGSTIVPFTGEDKYAMSYESGNRCLTVLSFVNREDIPQHLLVGTGVLYIFPQRDNTHAAVALSAFVQALEELNKVALVRRVYNKNSAPRLGALYPKRKEKYECLVYVELPFSEDIVQFTFPPLTNSKTKPTPKQLALVDQLIDNMDLMTANDGEEAFHPKKTLDPYQQHLYSCLAERGLNEKSEVTVKPFVKNLLKSPFEDDENCKTVLEEMKKNFNLKVTQPKQPRKRAVDEFKQWTKDDIKGEPEADDKPKPAVPALNLSSYVVAVGTLKPEQDFKELIERGEPAEEVCKQLQQVVLDLVLKSHPSENFQKPKSALGCLREFCITKCTTQFNEWLLQLKTNVLERGRKKFWDMIVNDKLGLISSDESPQSSVTYEEALKYFELEQPSVKNEMDADALFDEM